MLHKIRERLLQNRIAATNQLREKKHFNCVVVATAHRLARLMWTLLTKQTLYSPLFVQNTQENT